MDINTITLCGGGNAAHALIPIIRTHFQGTISLFLPYKDEAEHFQFLIREDQHIKAYTPKGVLNARPDRVSKSAAEACQDADLVIISLPAFAHEFTLSQILPFLKPNALVGTMPARSGFEYSALRLLQDHQREAIGIFGFQTLPWACRITHYAREVDILGQKASVGLAAFPHSISEELADDFTRFLGLTITPLPNMLTLSLANVGQLIHPGIMYGLFKGQEDCKYRKEDIPYFYQGVTQETARTLEHLSAEVRNVTQALQTRNPVLDLSQVISLKEWLLTTYSDSIADSSSLQSCFVTNRAYQGLRAPMKEIEDGYFLPDFQARYLTEDIPYGLVVTRAIAQLAGVQTPAIDEVITTTSRWMHKSYLERGELCGKDIQDTRIPQKYGIQDVKDIMF
ncbi:strombine dehydrogenase [Candidatus Vecturithrix granuli]|uniref:Strombine dehydrogenase n=1 Tax=Vecturithrix granuli TaxID=1499967 RepID=A0A081BWR8_VECG1|nr:strombine dehydrogenase [Candidatus Vecturithrix granuli]